MFPLGGQGQALSLAAVTKGRRVVAASPPPSREPGNLARSLPGPRARVGLCSLSLPPGRAACSPVSMDTTTLPAC